jgi:hypothetical protein
LAPALLFISGARTSGSELVSKLDNQEADVKRQYHCETRSIAPEQIETLVVSLGDRVRLLDYDIGAEEERTRCKDRRDAAYSILARTLVARRDNLSATIASLQERVATSAAD